jgi:hypothetical protein
MNEPAQELEVDGVSETEESDAVLVTEESHAGEPSGLTQSKSNFPSELELICEQYLADPGGSSTHIDRIAGALFNDARVRKICRLRALKNGVDIEGVDDVLQRVMEVFFGRMLARLRTADAVYAVVYAIADNVSKEVGRESSALVYNHDSIEAMREEGEELDAAGPADPDEEDTDLRTDTRRAIERLSSAWKKVLTGELTLSNQGVFSIDQNPMVKLVAPANVVVPPPKPKPKARQGGGKGGSGAELSPEQAELVQICGDMGLRNQDFAVMLNIGLPRLSSYIYGRTASVDPDVMKRARELHAEHKKTARIQKARFDRKMSEILTGWAKRLGAESDSEMAALLNVTNMTIHRWRHDATKPDQTALVRYDQYVDTLVRRLEQAVKVKSKRK